MSNNEYLLRLKQASINMMSRRGYDVSEDLPVMDYIPEDMGDYHKYAGESANPNEEGNINLIRSILVASSFGSNQRAMLSTLYRREVEYVVEGSDDGADKEPSYFKSVEYAIVYFVPSPEAKSKEKVAKSLFKPVADCQTQSVAQEGRITDIVIITLNSLTPVAQRTMMENTRKFTALNGTPFGPRSQDKANCEIFLDSEMLIDPTKHILCGRTVLLTSREQYALFKEGTISPLKILRINVNNPVVKYLGGCYRQIIRGENDAVIPGTIIGCMPDYYLITIIQPTKRSRSTVKK